MEAPQLAMLALIGTALWTQVPASKAGKLAVQNRQQQTPGGHPMDRATYPSQIWVDKAVNTTLRNDAKGNTPAEIDAYLRSVYQQEAASHPGVRMLA